MTNLCFICGKVTSEPELRFCEETLEEQSASFNLDITLKGISLGWIRVVCNHDLAKLAANELYKGAKVLVVGHLIRGALMIKGDKWWGEIAVVANILEVTK